MSSKRERKRARKELVRARQRSARRLGITALPLLVVTAVGVVAIVALRELVEGDASRLLVGPVAGAALLACAVLVRREVVALRRMSWLGWAGIACVGLLGVVLAVAQLLYVTGPAEVAAVVGLTCIVPALLAIGFLGAELVGSDGKTDDMATVRMMQDISNLS